MGNTGFEKAFINRTNAGNGITVWNWRGGVCCPAFFAISQKIFEMSERCNNSACFSVEIKGTSDIYSSSKSLMIILPFMEEAICYCNNAKLTIESFSYLGQLNNYITLLIQPVRKFFRAGCSCFYSLFSLQGFFLKVGKGNLYFFQTVSRKACGIFYPVYFVAPVLAFIFIKQVIVIFS